MPVLGGALPLVPIAELAAELEPVCASDEPVSAALPSVAVALLLWAAGLLWADLMMMAANSSGSVSRPLVLIVSWNCWARSAGGGADLGGGAWVFCRGLAPTTSIAPSLRASIRSGSIQARRL